jgi:methionyl aminopeptidase
VFTIEPFLSTGARTAISGRDEWTLLADGGHPTVQYEHTVVATRRGPLVLTLP